MPLRRGTPQTNQPATLHAVAPATAPAGGGIGRAAQTRRHNPARPGGATQWRETQPGQDKHARCAARPRRPAAVQVSPSGALYRKPDACHRPIPVRHRAAESGKKCPTPPAMASSNRPGPRPPTSCAGTKAAVPISPGEHRRPLAPCSQGHSRAWENRMHGPAQHFKPASHHPFLWCGQSGEQAHPPGGRLSGPPYPLFTGASTATNNAALPTHPSGAVSFHRRGFAPCNGWAFP